MNLEDDSGLRAERRAIIFGVGSIGGPDFDHLRAGPRHDIRHPEGAADFDQFTARHDGLAVLRQRVEAKQHRGGIVIDDGRILRAGELAQQRSHVIVALAALPG